MTAYISEKALILILAGLIGMVCHIAKKAMRGELGVASTNPFQIAFYVLLWKFIFTQNPGASMAAVLTLISICLGIVALGQIESLPMNVVAALGFTTGWASNSAANKGGGG